MAKYTTPHSSPAPRPHTQAVVGGAFGDEGKGRIIDNCIEKLLKRKSVKKVYVVRYQGGNNAGHSIEKNGIKLALHLVPSFVLYKKAYGIMDRGEVIHAEDLITEIQYIEKTLKESITTRLFLSKNAILCTDLERAEEVLNRAKNGNAKGGTGRGISPSYAHFIDRTGWTIRDLLAKDWKEKFAKRYDEYAKIFSAFKKELDGKSLATSPVPDYAQSVKTGKAAVRTVGSKTVFLSRLTKSRNYLLRKHIVINTHDIYRKIYSDRSIGILFEASQAAGLDVYNGTRPDVTSSDTTISGIKTGTGFFLEQDIEDSFAVIKATYTSSVGARKMPTHVDNEWSQWVQKEAHEYGTTTGRPRDINILDLPMLSFNLRISGAKYLALTHLDIARVDMPIKICTHYTDKKGKPAFYQPYLADLAEVIPHYITLPSWDGKLCQKAKTAKDLPLNARRFLQYLEQQLSFPIAAVTTGPDRKHFLMLQ